jgi:NAD(P)-dependent dehydrogenase (short-subunit alcohol dehydrogenase family)
MKTILITGANRGMGRQTGRELSGIVWLASEAPHELTGRFFRDGQEIKW